MPFSIPNIFDCAILCLIIGSAYLTFKTDKLTGNGAVVGTILASLIFLGGGFTSLSMLIAFFVLGTLATEFKRAQKAVITNDSSTKRKLIQVISNAGLSGVLGLLILFYPDQRELYQLLIAACFSSATADTLASELGTVFGKRFYGIMTFRREERGIDGAISLNGTLLGILGSGIIACIYSVGYGWSAHFYWIVIAGTIGNLADSVFGATLQRAGYINNSMVNLLNTIVAASLATMLYLIS